MGKLKSILIGMAALCCPFLVGTSTSAGLVLRNAAYYSAGLYGAELTEYSSYGSSEDVSGDSSDSSAVVPESSYESFSGNPEELSSGESSDSPSASGEPEASNNPADPDSFDPEKPPKKLGKIITKNRTEFTDDTDFSEFADYGGDILRYNFGKSSADDYINLSSGAQVRNCTELSNDELLEASGILPELDVAADSEQPAVLIYHTHTSESFLPYEDWFDSDYPIRSRDPERNMIAVGDAICEALSERGIAVVHDCAVHDYPMYTGAYYRSAETVLKDLEEYPSIKIVLDIHRDGIINADGSLSAPICSVDGKDAAQFMIISGCDDGEMDMPNYMENFKLACLLQECSENAYPDLARAVLFDYRNYNQSLSDGSLLIEVGSHGNSLDEAVYTGTLLGNIIADAVEKMQ